MKTQSFKTATRNAAGTFILASVLFVNANAANLPEPAAKDSTGKNAHVQCLGFKDNQCHIKVKYHNVSGNKFNVAVKDKDGYIIFQESFSDKKFDKLFKVNQEEEGTLTIIVRNLKDNTISTFDVNTTKRVYEELMITKVD